MSPFHANLVSGMSTRRVSCVRDTPATSRVRNKPGGRMARESRCATAEVEEARPRTGAIHTELSRTGDVDHRSVSSGLTEREPEVYVGSGLALDEDSAGQQLDRTGRVT